ncbi:ectoine synthase [Rhodobacteraceae bacterium KMM 6894]|nr:ectoine synthase [Rhodobacteraceae bacterium KMM 6894]
MLVKECFVQWPECKKLIEAHHWINGEGEGEEVATGRKWPVRPGTMYVLDRHDAPINRRSG